MWTRLVATVKWLEKDAHGARNRHSDKEKFPCDLNRSESCEMSERLLKTLRKSGDFQAECIPDAAATLQMATISECRYRWLRLPDLNRRRIHRVLRLLTVSAMDWAAPLLGDAL